MVHLRTLMDFVGGARFFACDSCLLTSMIMRKILFSLVVSVSLALCEPPPSSQYGYPSNFGGATGNGNFVAANNYRVHGGGHSYTDHEQDGNQDYVDNYPQSYEFGYAIKDVATGNDFGRRETSDGETVRGEYRVQLPDGRTQIVTYTADWRSGFHADVRYEGTATYPDQYSMQNNNNQGYDFQGNSNSNSNNIGAGYNGGQSGAYSNYQNKGVSYNDNNYQFASNSIDNNYNFGARNNFKPVYGPPFG